MDINQCIKCGSHYMNGDDKWCNHFDCCCEDISNDCEYFEEFEDVL